MQLPWGRTQLRVTEGAGVAPGLGVAMGEWRGAERGAGCPLQQALPCVMRWPDSLSAGGKVKGRGSSGLGAGPDVFAPGQEQPVLVPMPPLLPLQPWAPQLTASSHGRSSLPGVQTPGSPSLTARARRGTSEEGDPPQKGGREGLVGSQPKPRGEKGLARWPRAPAGCPPWEGEGWAGDPTLREPVWLSAGPRAGERMSAPSAWTCSLWSSGGGASGTRRTWSRTTRCSSTCTSRGRRWAPQAGGWTRPQGPL